jgi:hypothetical protein
MQQVYVTRTLADVYLVRDYLAAEGVPTEIRNEHLFGAQGEVPVTSDALPSLWAQDDLVARARELIERHRSSNGAAAAAALDAMDTEESPAPQQTLSDLFDVADRLARGMDGQLIDQAGRLEAVISGSAPPFGVEPLLWVRAGELAQYIVGAAERGDSDNVRSTAGELRDLLRVVV